MNKEYLKGRVIKSKTGRISVVVSDETVDRSGESLPVKAWDFSNFLKSPRMFADHDYSIQSITGKWENVRVENNQVIMDPVFHELTDLSKINKALVETGFLDATSVGFLRKAQKDGSVINELFEVSWVGVPCNPNARVLTAESLAAVKAFAGVEEEPEQANTETETEEGAEAAKVEPEKTEEKVGEEKPVEEQTAATEEAKPEEKGIIDDTNAAHEEMMKVKRSYLDQVYRAVWRFCDAYCSDAVATESITTMVADLCEQLTNIASLEQQPMAEDEGEEVMMGIKSYFAQKAGRVLSSKNRDIISTSIDSMSASIAALKELLDATQPEGDEEAKAASGNEKKGAEPENAHAKLLKAFKDFNSNGEGSSTRLLRIINTATRDALHRAKQRRG